jgi:hypothetical protein
LKKVIVLKGLKHPADHAVLKEQWPLKTGDFAQMADGDPELPRLPPDSLVCADDAGGHTADRSDRVRLSGSAQGRCLMNAESKSPQVLQSM